MYTPAHFLPIGKPNAIQYRYPYFSHPEWDKITQPEFTDAGRLP
jgi:hypothetical protein